MDSLDPAAIREEITLYLSSRKRPGSNIVAFYGGTFTSNPLDIIEEILKVTDPFRREGLVSSIRVSTRPDCLDKEKLSLMKEHGVETVELGVQSMDDGVLDAVARGHKAQDTVEAFALLKEMGFEVGAQIMAGLPSDSPLGFLETVERIIALRPSMARIYPTLVIEGTPLASWYRKGLYRPLGLEEAVELCGKACRRLEDEGIRVIRIGLSPSPSLVPGKELLAGPWHPGLGFMVKSAAYLQRCLSRIGRLEGERILIKVPPREISLLRGFANRNISAIEEATGSEVEAIEADESLSENDIRIEVL
jgi:histone acetyltransferase (RNA polymerase elongator complex component)